MTTTTVTAELLAAKFSAILRDWLTAEQMEQVIQRNAAETHPGICHSHDFCDANMAMLEAAELFGLDCDSCIHDEAANRLWNAAWNLAKAKAFTFGE